MGAATSNVRSACSCCVGSGRREPEASLWLEEFSSCSAASTSVEPSEVAPPQPLVYRHSKHLLLEEPAEPVQLPRLGLGRAACCRRRPSSPAEARKAQRAPLRVWARPLDDIEAEWQAVARSIHQEELERLRSFRRLVEAEGLDRHEACSSERGSAPHSRRAGTLLRFLRARSGKAEAAVALLREALDWRRDYGIDRRLADWRSEWAAGSSKRVCLIKEFDFVGILGKDRDNLPVFLHRHAQGDLGGLVREIGDEPVLLHTVRMIEDSLEEARKLMLQTGRFLSSFVEIHDVGHYGLVPKYMPRAFTAMPFYKTYAPVFDKVYPERLRVAFVVRAPTAFAVVWRFAQPLIPEATKHKIRFKGYASATWAEEMNELLPESMVPAWLRSDDKGLLRQARPWGGIVPVGAGSRAAGGD